MLFSQYKNRSDYSFRFEVAPLSITVAILMVRSSSSSRITLRTSR